jgi:hypothetical protein
MDIGPCRPSAGRRRCGTHLTPKTSLAGLSPPTAASWTSSCGDGHWADVDLHDALHLRRRQRHPAVGREDLALQRAARTEWDHGQAVAGADGKGGATSAVVRGKITPSGRAGASTDSPRLWCSRMLWATLNRAKHPLQLVERFLVRRGRRHPILFLAEPPTGAAPPSLRVVRCGQGGAHRPPCCATCQRLHPRLDRVRRVAASAPSQERRRWRSPPPEAGRTGRSRNQIGDAHRHLRRPASRIASGNSTLTGSGPHLVTETTPSR